MSQDLPPITKVLERIQQIRRKEIRMAVLYEYVIAGRISEVVGRSYSSDTHTIARGPTGEAASQDSCLIGDHQEPAIVFSVNSAKRRKRSSENYAEGLLRKVGLPRKDPIASQLLDYFGEFGKDLVFPFTRQEVSQEVKRQQTFRGFSCSVEDYQIYRNGEIIAVPSHQKPYTLHSLRHQRASDLINYYGFDGFNLSAYGGWSVRNTTGVSKVMTRYIHLQWQAYFPKLLKVPEYERIFYAPAQ
jgi:hypothetical protein